MQGILFIYYLFIYVFNHEIFKPAPKPQYGVTSVPPWGSMCMYPHWQQ